MPKGLRIPGKVVRPRARLGSGIRQRVHVALAPPPSTPEGAVPVTALDDSWDLEEALPAKRWKSAVALFGVLSALAYGTSASGSIDMERPRAAIDDPPSRAAPGAFGVPPRAEPMSRALQHSSQVKSRLQTAR
jgi:hypothetical protein